MQTDDRRITESIIGSSLVSDARSAHRTSSNRPQVRKRPKIRAGLNQPRILVGIFYTLSI